MSRRVFFRDSEAQGFSTYGLLLDTLFRQLKAVGVAGYFPYEYQEDMRCGYAELVSFFGEGFGRLAEQEGDTSNLSILSKHASLRGLLLEKYRKDNERYLAARNSLSIKSLKKAEEVNEPSWDKLYASAEAEDARREEGIRDSGEGKPDSAVVNSFLAAINGAHAVDDSSAPVYVEDDEEPVGGYFSDEDEEYSSELPDDDDYDDEDSSELPDDDDYDDEGSSELPDDDDEYDEEDSSELPDDDEDDFSELSADNEAGYSPKLSAERVVPNPSVYVAPVVSNMVVRPSYARGIPGRETQEAVLDMMDRLANNIKGWFSRL